MSEIDTTENDAQNGEVIAETPHDQFLRYMHNRAEIDGANNTFDVQSSMMDKILTAQSEEDIWEADEAGLEAGQSLVDVELEVRSMKVLKSNRPDFDNGMGVYIVVNAVRLDTGEEIIFNTGAPGLITKLRAFEALGKFPLQCVIKARTAGNGDVLKLRPIPKRASQITASAE